ncbi:type IV secretory system conjugative DNA transfer family protein [Steroidobacter sp. S1-65]|uniref:Type IV secretory system conjugative DNA transfer family protein n=1 Tax=Steroidobacter gossypii TaxID=2805490 RepID=A0ABS1X6N0_9GAMM|nr:type IV secretory system conjugative DNA transfer family protein [Steroidobacter gossypii]MBM0108874.1 type IV secretory system conjugative DNA transfer family protein [Steroidobacter gossypii]
MAALIAAQYVAGCLLLLSLGIPVSEASPLTIARYGYYYGDWPAIVRNLWWCSGVGAALVAGIAAVALVPRRAALHGEARFARSSEIRQAGLLTGQGLILGELGGWWPWGRRFITLPGQQGVALSAQPRSGKGVGVVIPNLLTWEDSVVCVDIKKENWTLTAGWRAASGSEVFLFDPLDADGRTHRWNMLDYVGESLSQQIDDLQLIANMLFPDPPGADPFWMASGRSLFLGIGLYVFATPSLPRTIGEILRQGMADDEEGFSAHWRRVIQGRMKCAHPLPEQCVRALSDVIDLAPQTASSIRKTFTSRLELWANPRLDAATSASDFDLRQFRRKRMSLYIAVRPKDLHRLQPILALLFQQTIALQTDELPEHNPELRYQLALIMDEGPALGRIPIIAEASAFTPGFNIRTLFVMQTPSQLREVYGEHGSRTLLKTLAGRIYFAPKDMEEAEELSRELGTTTVKVKSHSRPAFFSGGMRGHHNVSISEQRRALMLPQEVCEMGPEKALIFMEGIRPILARKIRYYEVPWLAQRVMPPPEVPAIEPILPAAVPAGKPNADTAASAAAAGELRARRANLEDIERIDELTLEDFDVDLSSVVFPETEPGERVSDQDLELAAESFLAALKGDTAGRQAGRS